MNKWISVQDRLPDVNKTKSGYEQEMVIAATKRNSEALIYERACIRGKTAYRWKWAWGRIYDGDDITHWMPLPEPPTDGAET